MRETVMILGDSCCRCPHHFVGLGMYCFKVDKPLTTSTRHRDCPYGNRVITVVMTDEDTQDSTGGTHGN